MANFYSEEIASFGSDVLVVPTGYDNGGIATTYNTLTGEIKKWGGSIHTSPAGANWRYGAARIGTKVYMFSGFDAEKSVLEFDYLTKKYKKYLNGVLAVDFWGSVAVGSRVYGIPKNDSTTGTCYFDTISKKVVLFDPSSEIVVPGARGGTVVGNKIYIFPKKTGASYIYELNTINNTARQININYTTVANNFSVPCTVGNSVYCYTFGTDVAKNRQLVKFNTVTEEFKVFDINIAKGVAPEITANFFFSSFAMGTKIYAVPSDDNIVIIFDTLTEKFTSISQPFAASFGGGRWTMATSVGSKIYMAPWSGSDCLLTYDALTENIECINIPHI